jgi:hypothetical protein
MSPLRRLMSSDDRVVRVFVPSPRAGGPGDAIPVELAIPGDRPAFLCLTGFRLPYRRVLRISPPSPRALVAIAQLILVGIRSVRINGNI